MSGVRPSTCFNPGGLLSSSVFNYVPLPLNHTPFIPSIITWYEAVERCDIITLAIVWPWKSCGGSVKSKDYLPKIAGVGCNCNAYDLCTWLNHSWSDLLEPNKWIQNSKDKRFPIKQQINSTYIFFCIGSIFARKNAAKSLNLFQHWSVS